MNITVIIIELVVMCIVFGLVVFGMLCISPLSFINDYPPEIQETYYRTQHKEATKEKLTKLMVIKKILALLFFLFLFAWMLHVAGATTFLQGLCLSYIYILCAIAWDTLFIDWVLFANVKRIRLPGTEHMDKAYRQKWFHVKACFPGIPVFLVIGLLSAGVMTFIW